MIPRDTPLSLDEIARCICEAPADLGVAANVQVRSVLVRHADGRWINHYTVLRAGVDGGGSAIEDFQADDLRLTDHTYSAQVFTDRNVLLRALTSWQDSDLTSAFQQSANAHHQASSNRWSEYPCWFIDAHDNQPNARDFNGPRGPFKNKEKKFFAEDLPTAVALWAGDPTSQDNTIRNAYRIILPDRRAYFTKRSFDGQRLILAVSGMKRDRVSCALTTGGGGKREWKEVVNGSVEFILADSPPSHLEVFLLDEFHGWCDRYHNPLEPKLFTATAGGVSFPFSTESSTEELPGDASITEALAGLHAPAVYTAWQRALERRVNDPEGAITLARTLLETECKHILDDAQIPYAPDADLVTLYRKVAGELGLAPSEETEQIFKRLFGGVTSVVTGLEALRNQAGDAHGRSKAAAKPLDRHAHLAVNLAGAVAAFLAETREALRVKQ